MQQGYNQISLLISGNLFHSAGFQPIIAIGRHMLQLTYQSYPGLDTVPNYYVLKNTPDYTQYTLVHNQVTSVDGVSGTMLKIAIAIPAGSQLQNGVSALTLLDEIRDAFTTLYMEPTLGMEGGLTYKKAIPNKAVFEEILSRYPLCPTYIPQCVNEGTSPGIFVASRETMGLLFQDVQYKEFKPYSEVIVTSEADCSFYKGHIINELNNGMGIPIPPIRSFRQSFNNNEKDWQRTASMSKSSNFATTINHHKKTILAAGLTTIALLLAGIIFLGIRGKDGNEKNGGTSQTAQGGGHQKQVGEKETPKFADFIKESEEKLKEDSLLFTTVEDIFTKYQRYLKDGKEKDELGETITEFGEKICMYKNLVDIINKRTDIAAGDSLRKLRAYIYESGELKNKCDTLIDKKHLDYINILFIGKGGNEWKPKNGDNKYQSAKLLYSSSTFEINSFKDFEKIVEEIQKSNTSDRLEVPTPLEDENIRNMDTKNN